MVQPDPTPSTHFTFRVDHPDLEIPQMLTCRMQDLPTHMFRLMQRLNGLTVGQAPMMIEIRRVD